jgi:hypothetical protein
LVGHAPFGASPLKSARPESAGQKATWVYLIASSARASQRAGHLKPSGFLD